MSHKIVIFVVTVCLGLSLYSGVRAQTTSTSENAGKQVLYSENIYGIGLYASLTSGMGISFKQHIANIPIAYQITGGAWKTSQTLWDIGGEFQYDLATSSNRLYAIAAAGYYSYPTNSKSPAGPTRFGLGIGYEIAGNQAIGVSLALIITSFQPSGDILPLPSVGLHYYFR